MSQEYIAFLEAEVAKVKTRRCPNCAAALRSLHCCTCEGCDGCRAYEEARVTKLEQAAKAALTNIQGMLDGNDLPSMVIRDMLRAALHPQPGETK